MKEGTPCRIVGDRRVWIYRNVHQSKTLGVCGRLVTGDGKETFKPADQFGALCADCTDRVVDRGGGVKDSATLPKSCTLCDAIRQGTEVPATPRVQPARAETATPDNEENEMPNALKRASTITSKKHAPKKAASKKAAPKRTAAKAEVESRRGRKPSGPVAPSTYVRGERTGIVGDLMESLLTKGTAKALDRGNTRAVLFYAAKRASLRISTRKDGAYIVADVLNGAAKTKAAPESAAKKAAAKKAAPKPRSGKKAVSKPKATARKRTAAAKRSKR